jgi:hypothetical protein
MYFCLVIRLIIWSIAIVRTEGTTQYTVNIVVRDKTNLQNPQGINVMSGQASIYVCLKVCTARQCFSRLLCNFLLLQ